MAFLQKFNRFIHVHNELPFYSNKKFIDKLPDSVASVDDVKKLTRADIIAALEASKKATRNRSLVRYVVLSFRQLPTVFVVLRRTGQKRNIVVIQIN